MADDLQAAAERARQQSEAFLNRSREQMLTTFAAQRQMGVGSVPGSGGTGSAGSVGGSPMAGTPAGNMLNTLTDLIRKGAGTVGGAIASPITSTFAGAQAGGSMVAGAAGFAVSSQPFGFGGMGSGSMTGAQSNMSTWQMLHAGFGGNLPGTMGSWAGQRMDMTPAQTQEVAREEIKSRLRGGLWKGVQKGWGIATLGASDFYARKYGAEIDVFRKDDYNRNLQQNLRFTTGETLQKAGLGGFRGAFATGITREGANVIGEDLRADLGRLQSETGASADQLMAIQGRAMGTIGSLGLNRALGGGVESFRRKVGDQTRNIRDIQQNLHLSEEEADQFFKTMGQMQGTAQRIADMSRTAKRAAGRMGMDVRDVFGVMKQFEDTGRLAMTGQAATGATGLRMAERYRGWQQGGLMNREEAMMYGGNTYEEGLQLMTQRAYSMGTGMYNTGKLGGMGLMMRYGGKSGARFMAGGMGALEMAGEVGGMMAADPLMGLRSRYDEKIQRMTGEEGIRAQYTKVMAMKASGQFMFNGKPEELYQAMERNTDMAPLEAKRWFKFYDKERQAVQSRVKGVAGYDDMSKTDQDGHKQAIMMLHNRLRSEGKLDLAQELTGKNAYDAVGQVYAEGAGRGYDMAAVPLDKIIRESFAAQEKKIGANRVGDTRGLMRSAGGIVGARVALDQASRNKKFGTNFINAEHMATLGKTLDEAGLSKEEIFNKLLTVGGSGDVLAKSTRSMEYTTLKAAGFALDVTGKLGFGTPGGSQDVIAFIKRDGTDVTKNIFAVEALGETHKMSMENIQKYFPELAADAARMMLEGTRGLDSVSGLQEVMRGRGSSAGSAARFTAAKERHVLNKFGGVAGSIFGRRANNFKFGDLVENLKKAASGKFGMGGNADAYSSIMNKLPELKGFMSAFESGELNIDDLTSQFGDSMAGVLSQVTGKDLDTVKTGLTTTAGRKDLFDDKTIKGLFAHVIGKQSIESLPLGGEGNPNVIKFAKGEIKTLSDSIAAAIKNASSGGSSWW